MYIHFKKQKEEYAKIINLITKLIFKNDDITELMFFWLLLIFPFLWTSQDQSLTILAPFLHHHGVYDCPRRVSSQDFQDGVIPGQETNTESSHSPVGSDENR